jgi:predicted nucleic acid-binding protein
LAIGGPLLGTLWVKGEVNGDLVIDATKWCRPNYFDASALVKLVADDVDEEPGRIALRRYYWSNTASVYATSFSVAESLSAFKTKFLRGRISESEYIRDVREFLRLTVGSNLRIDEVPILSPVATHEAERMIKLYGIDFLDCLQIVTILHGQFKHLGPNSKSLLITADEELAKAARAEGVNVWHCINEPAPRSGKPDMLKSSAAGL